MILNKSDIELDQYDKEVLSKDHNFAPTPAWGRSVENNEWHNAYRHVLKGKNGERYSVTKLK